MVEVLMPNIVSILHAKFNSKVPKKITQLNHYNSKENTTKGSDFNIYF
jgi:hypothetical protein